MSFFPKSLDPATVMTCALLSADVYRDAALYHQPLLSGWQCVDEVTYQMKSWANKKQLVLVNGSYAYNEIFKSLFIRKDLTWPKDFFARLYCHEKSGQAIIAYRGTGLQRVGNLVSDIEIDAQYYGSYDLAAAHFYLESIKILEKNKPNISLPPLVTGHSLGGYLAQVVADHYRNQHVVAIVFNAPGTVGLYNSVLHRQVNGDNPYIYNIVNSMDFIHLLGGRQAGHVIYLDNEDDCVRRMHNNEQHEAIFFHEENISWLKKIEEHYYIYHEIVPYYLCGFLIEHAMSKVILNLEKMPQRLNIDGKIKYDV